ncbi:hypothetical protein VPH35_123522 [Triticum aestivum]
MAFLGSRRTSSLAQGRVQFCPRGRAVHLARPYETVVTFSLRRGEEIRRSPTVVEVVATTRVNNSEIPPLGCTAVQFWWAPLSSGRRVCSAVRWRGSHHWTPAVLFPSRTKSHAQVQFFRCCYPLTASSATCYHCR